MGLPDWAPREVDVETPSAARMYDFWLGGFHNFVADRTAANRMAEAMPSAPTVARANRDFLRRAVRWLVGQGVRQFLDVGSGIPTVGNVHEVAQEAATDARVVYVDIDPVAVTHSRQILAGNDRAAAIRADLRSPDMILSAAEVRATLDLSRPVGLLLVSTLHFVPDTDRPYEAVARLRDSLAPGSYLVISHGAVEGFDGTVLPTAERVYRATSSGMGGLRTRAQIHRFFGDFTLVDPGLVWLTQWRPDDPDPPDQHPERSAFLAGVARRPDPRG
jgi:SAM-dependent methyltransferase